MTDTKVLLIEMEFRMRRSNVVWQLVALVFLIGWTLFMLQQQPLLLPLALIMILAMIAIIIQTAKMKVILSDTELVYAGIFKTKRVDLKDIKELCLYGPNVRDSFIEAVLKDGSSARMGIGEVKGTPQLIQAMMDRAPHIKVDKYLQIWLEKYSKRYDS